MQYQVFVRGLDHQYTASIVGIPDCTVSASTKDEAITKAKAVLAERLVNGELVTIEINPQPSDDARLMQHFGVFVNDLTFDDFLAEVAAYRQQADEEIDH